MKPHIFSTVVYDHGRFIDILDEDGVTVTQVFAKGYSNEVKIEMAKVVAAALTDWRKTNGNAV